MIPLSARVLSVVALNAALVTGGCNRPAKSVTGGSLKSEKERRAAPEFSLKDAEGKTVRLSDYKGKVVLLNFWATWCGPCKIEIPWFMEFEQKYRDKGFAILGISMDEDGWDVVRPYIDRFRINYRILLGNEEVGLLYGGVESLPTTFIIDRDGRVASVHVGLASKSDYQNDIDQILGTSGNGAARMGAPAFITRAK